MDSVIPNRTSTALAKAGATVPDVGISEICELIFAEHAREALDALQDGIEAARAALRPGYGHLVVGSYPSVSSVFLPSVLACLNASHPAMSVEIYEGNAATLEAALSSGTVDVAFRPLQPPVRDHRLTTRALWRESIVAVSGIV